jgi:general L-amino acid transport system substrate-binding protein
MIMKTLKIAAIGAALLFSGAVVQAGPTFDAVKQKGFVQCGVTTGVAGFSNPDSKGVWKGIDVDMCKAIAAAMFNDAEAFKVTPLTAVQRFTALQSGEIDVLTRNTTQTLTRDTTLGLVGTGVNFYDGQGVMVKKDLGIKGAKELNGATICVQPGTTTELNLADWFRANSISFKPVVIEKLDEIIRAFVAGRCDAFTTDKSQLAGVRTTLENPDAYEILPDTFSKEPLGPMVRQGDDAWFNVVRWTLFAMIEAEEYGITSKNAQEMLKSSDPNVQRILGTTPGMGKNLGLSNEWAFSVVSQVGNYGETFERNVGADSPLKLERGLNATWRNGGLMYGWPIR